MAPTADETRRQLEGLRHEVSAILGELDRRRRRTLTPRALAAQVAGTARRTSEEHPLAIGLLGLAIVLGAGALVARSRERSRAARRPSAVLGRLSRGAADELLEGLERARARGRRLRDLTEPPERAAARVRAGEPSMLKKLLWMGLTSALMALGSLAARRLSSTIWTRAMKERPPTGEA